MARTFAASGSIDKRCTATSKTVFLSILGQASGCFSCSVLHRSCSQEVLGGYLYALPHNLLEHVSCRSLVPAAPFPRGGKRRWWLEDSVSHWLSLPGAWAAPQRPAGRYKFSGAQEAGPGPTLAATAWAMSITEDQQWSQRGRASMGLGSRGGWLEIGPFVWEGPQRRTEVGAGPQTAPALAVGRVVRVQIGDGLFIAHHSQQVPGGVAYGPAPGTVVCSRASHVGPHPVICFSAHLPVIRHAQPDASIRVCPRTQAPLLAPGHNSMWA